MKKISYLLLLVLCAASLVSCVSSKKIVYFQGSDELYKEAQSIMQQYEMKLKPADQVLIKLTCEAPELLLDYSSDVVMGTAATNYSNITQGGVSNAYGYTINNDGDLVLPVVGRVHVADLTVDEAAKEIEKMIKEKGKINKPEVTVRLLNARVTVMGAVRTPKVVSLTSERNTIVDVLSQCGDIADDGLRQHVKLFREINGQRMMYELNMTDVDLFTSPAYYVQQNDMIYVEPNKSKRVKSSAFYTFLSAGASVLSLVTAVFSIVAVMKK